MAQGKKNNQNNLRVTREGFRPARSDAPVESDMEKGWPPPWSVSFADMTTNLMCFFILWYALTVMKYPAHLLMIKTTKDLIVDIEETKEMLKAYDMIAVKEIDSGKFIEQAKKRKEMAEELKKFLEENALSHKIDLNIRGEEIVISSRDELFFDSGKAEIKPLSEPVLNLIAFVLKENVGCLLKIEGHTDDRPIRPYHQHKYRSNWELSTARAVSVARYLIDKEGIHPRRIAVSGYSALKPVVPNINPVNRAKNRRVEFHIEIGGEADNKSDGSDKKKT